jgi:hypothetical protein
VNATAERGGPFGRDERAIRNWMRASAPGIATRCRPAESSPLGSGAPVSRVPAVRSRRTLQFVLIALLACAGLAAFGNGLYIHARAQLAQVLPYAA